MIIFFRFDSHVWEDKPGARWILSAYLSFRVVGYMIPIENWCSKPTFVKTPHPLCELRFLHFAYFLFVGPHGSHMRGPRCDDDPALSDFLRRLPLLTIIWTTGRFSPTDPYSILLCAASLLKCLGSNGRDSIRAKLNSTESPRNFTTEVSYARTSSACDGIRYGP